MEGGKMEPAPWRFCFLNGKREAGSQPGGGPLEARMGETSRAKAGTYPTGTGWPQVAQEPLSQAEA